MKRCVENHKIKSMKNFLMRISHIIYIFITGFVFASYSASAVTVYYDSSVLDDNDLLNLLLTKAGCNVPLDCSGNYNFLFDYRSDTRIGKTYCGLEWGNDQNGQHIRHMVCTYRSHPDKNEYIGIPIKYRAAFIQDAPRPQQCVGNPINIADGSKFQQHIDIAPKQINGVMFGWTYSSKPKFNNLHWTHQYDYTLTKEVGTLFVGRSFFSKTEACSEGWLDFTKIYHKEYSNIPGVLINDTCKGNGTNVQLQIVNDIPLIDDEKPSVISLSRNDGSIYNFTRDVDIYRPITGSGTLIKQANGWRYSHAKGVELYDLTGKIKSITDNVGNTQSLFYNPTDNKLQRVTDSYGNNLQFTYRGNNLEKVEHNGVVALHYSYLSNGMLNEVMDTKQLIRQYHYEDPNFPYALTGITDARKTRYATWRYDIKGRAWSSEHANGVDLTTITFNANGSTTVTNPLNKKTTYLFEDILGVKRVTKVIGEPTANCLGANQNYTYTSEGFIDTQTDWKGNVTKFAYDNYGRELSRTEAFNTPDAKTTQTCWHPTLNAISRVIDPTLITVYDYWPTGQLKNTTTKPRPASTLACDTTL